MIIKNSHTPTHKSTFRVHYRIGSPGQPGLRVAGIPCHWDAGSQNMTNFRVWRAPKYSLGGLSLSVLQELVTGDVVDSLVSVGRCRVAGLLLAPPVANLVAGDDAIARVVGRRLPANDHALPRANHQTWRVK